MFSKIITICSLPSKTINKQRQKYKLWLWWMIVNRVTLTVTLETVLKSILIMRAQKQTLLQSQFQAESTVFQTPRTSINNSCKALSMSRIRKVVCSTKEKKRREQVNRSSTLSRQLIITWTTLNTISISPLATPSSRICKGQRRLINTATSRSMGTQMIWWVHLNSNTQVRVQEYTTSMESQLLMPHSKRTFLSLKTKISATWEAIRLSITATTSSRKPTPAPTSNRMAVLTDIKEE